MSCTQQWLVRHSIDPKCVLCVCLHGGLFAWNYVCALHSACSLVCTSIRPVLHVQATKIFVNGVWVGVHRDPAMLVRTLRQMRRQVRSARLSWWRLGFVVLPCLNVYGRFWQTQVNRPAMLV